MKIKLVQIICCLVLSSCTFLFREGVFAPQGTEHIEQTKFPAHSETVIPIEITPTIRKPLEIKNENKKTPTSDITVSNQITPITDLGEIEFLLQDRLNDNGSCDLPCFLGFNPDEDEFQNIKSFMKNLEQINQIDEYNSLYIPEDSDETIYIGMNSSHNFYDLQFSNTINNSTNYFYFYVDAIEQTFTEYFSYYLIQSIVDKYGYPSNVYIGVFPNAGRDNTDSWVPFDVLLDYSKDNFVISYYLPKKTENGNHVGCFSEINNLTLISWNVDNKKNIENVISDLSSTYWNKISKSKFREVYLPISNFMSVDEFGKLFSALDGEDCIAVQANAWPYE